jgi:ubiquinone/menaquinone biosynthesis C-methylase UbiE
VYEQLIMGEGNLAGDRDAVVQHYSCEGLLAAIETGLAGLGKTPESVTIDDLAPVDEFHIGGRRASDDFISQLPLSKGSAVLDIGCGLGGPARYTAQRFGARVTGIDLTSDFVAAGTAMCHWVGLADAVTLKQGSALDLPFEPASFDAAYMIHVGMNIADKDRLCCEAARVLKPGGHFGIYDVMQVGAGDLDFPVPWAEQPETSATAAPTAYRSALEQAGFTVTAERNRRDFALEFFAEMQAKMAAAGGPPPLSLHVLMGESRAAKVANMVANISSGRLAPVEMIAQKSAG